MRRLIYDMYYKDEITQDVAIKLLDKLTELSNKKRRWLNYQSGFKVKYTLKEPK